MNCEICLFLVLVRLAYEYIEEFDCESNEQKFKNLFDEMIMRPRWRWFQIFYDVLW